LTVAAKWRNLADARSRAVRARGPVKVPAVCTSNEGWPPMIEQLPGFPGNVVAFLCGGRITRRDYETVLVPAVEAALGQHEKVRLYYQIAPDFSHIEPGVSLDFRVGIDHLLRWDRIAIVTNLDWVRETLRAFGFLMPGAVEIFTLEEAESARQWVLAADAA
jgi:hypothetical protein